METFIAFAHGKMVHTWKNPLAHNTPGDVMQTLYDRPDVREILQTLDAEECQAFARLLSPRESVVLHGRFLGQPKRRWESLGRAMGVPRERVRQMEAEIIKKFDAWKISHEEGAVRETCR
jgi:DNA-directed RNA polymerase sigma subunit (sigma70/sigma32)